jgi:hypothetical protein
MIHRTKPDCLTQKPHSGEFRNWQCSQNNNVLVEPLMEVQRKKDVSQNVVMTRVAKEIHLPGQAAWGRGCLSL